jgi:hypothetical protein
VCLPGTDQSYRPLDHGKTSGIQGRIFDIQRKRIGSIAEHEQGAAGLGASFNRGEINRACEKQIGSASNSRSSR